MDIKERIKELQEQNNAYSNYFSNLYHNEQEEQRKKEREEAAKKAAVAEAVKKTENKVQNVTSNQPLPADTVNIPFTTNSSEKSDLANTSQKTPVVSEPVSNSQNIAQSLLEKYQLPSTSRLPVSKTLAEYVGELTKKKTEETDTQSTVAEKAFQKNPMLPSVTVSPPIENQSRFPKSQTNEQSVVPQNAQQNNVGSSRYDAFKKQTDEKLAGNIAYIANKADIGARSALASAYDFYEATGLSLSSAIESAINDLKNKETDSNKIFSNAGKAYTDAFAERMKSENSNLSYVQQDEQKMLENYAVDGLDPVTKFLGDVSGMIGKQSITALLATAATAAGMPQAGVTMLYSGFQGSSASASATQRALSSGATNQEAVAYGNVMGLISGSVSSLVKGVSNTGSSVTGKLSDTLVSNIKNPVIRELVDSFVVRPAGEAGEEIFQEYLDYKLQKLTYDPKAEFDFKGAVYLGVLAYVSTGIMEAPNAIGRLKSLPATYQDYELINKISKDVDEAKSYADVINAYETLESLQTLIKKEYDDVSLGKDSAAKTKALNRLTYYQTELQRMSYALKTNADNIVLKNSGASQYADYDIKAEANIINDITKAKTDSNINMDDIAARIFADVEKNSVNRASRPTDDYAYDFAVDSFVESDDNYSAVKIIENEIKTNNKAVDALNKSGLLNIDDTKRADLIKTLNQQNQRAYDMLFSIVPDYVPEKDSPLAEAEIETAVNASVPEIQTDTKSFTPLNQNEQEAAPKKYNLTVSETTHTKTGEPLTVAKIDGRLSSDEYKKLRQDLGKDAYYSSFAKGFIVKDEDALKKIGEIANITDKRIKLSEPDEAQTPVNIDSTAKNVSQSVKSPHAEILNKSLDYSGYKNFVDSIVDEYNPDMPKSEILNKVKELYNYMSEYDNVLKNPGADESMRWNGFDLPVALEMATDIADGIITSSREVDKELFRDYNDFKTHLKGMKISIPVSERADLDVVNGYNEFRKKNIGNFILSDSGTPVDTVYQELNELYPQYFSPEITAAADQIIKIRDVIKSLKSNYLKSFDGDEQKASSKLAMNILKGYYDVLPNAGTPKASQDVDSVSADKKITAPQKSDTANDVSLEEKIKKYPPEMQKVITEYYNSVNEDILNLAKDYRENPNQEFKRLNISKVTDRQVADIKDITGTDITGYQNAINKNAFLHIEKRHGISGEANTSMANLNDVARMNYVLENYDDAYLIPPSDGETGLSAEFKDKDNNPAPMVIFEKRIDGTYYLVEAIPDSRYKKIWVVTAYIQKNNRTVTQVSDVDNPTPKSTSETPLVSPNPVISDNIIPQNDIDVNTNIRNNSDADTAISENKGEDYGQRKLTADRNDNQTDKGHDGGNVSEVIQETQTPKETGRNTETHGGDLGGERGVHVSDVRKEPNTGSAVRTPEPVSIGDINGEVEQSVSGERGSGSASVRNDGGSGKQQLNSDNYTLDGEFIDSHRPSYQDNLAAINTLKSIEAESRTATPEEQEILSKYKGWGGLKDAFTNYNSVGTLTKLLTPEEYKNAKASVLNAHYTSTKVIDRIYDALKRMGFSGGNLLEPSMGTGNFFGVIPKNLKSKTNLYGVELDSITGRIAQQLYPDADISIKGFQDTGFDDGSFDVVVGNVPFLDVHYNYRKGKYMLHDYFFIKSLDLLRDGGVAAMITSTGTLDKGDSKARNAMMERADLVAAFRLPNDAFKINAGTEVTTDLLIFQKRPSDVSYSGEAFTSIGDIGGVPINEYFVKHPENILGELVSEKGMYANERTQVKAKDNFESAFDKAVSRLPKNILKEDYEPRIIRQSGDQTKTGVDVLDGKSVRYDNDGNAVAVSGKDAKIIDKYVKMRDVYDGILKSSQDGNTDIESYRNKLKSLYEDFKNDSSLLAKGSKENRMSDKAVKRLLGDDPGYWRVAGLEKTDKEGNVIESDVLSKNIFSKKEISNVESVSDAVAVSLNKSGKIDLDYIQKITGKSKNQILDNMSDVAVKTPDGEIVPNPVYLSGNIREKLRAAEKAASVNPAYKKNVDMLKAVMPKDRTAAEITPQLGSTWIPPETIGEFIQAAFNVYSKPDVSYNPVKSTWHIAKYNPSPASRMKYGTRYIEPNKLLELALEQKSPQIYDKSGNDRVLNRDATAEARQKQTELKQAFQEWAFKEKWRRDKLVEIYNDKFNNFRPMDYDEMSKYLRFDTLSPDFNMRDYQSAAVARVLFGGNTLLAHGVGTGKTAEMISSAMEAKRMGITKKNLFVVPKHKVADFRSETLRMYPSANVLMATEDDFKPDRRKKFASMIASNDWDIVVIGHTSFQMLPVSSDTQADYIRNEIDNLEKLIRETAENKNANTSGRRFLKDLEKSKLSAENKLEQLLDKKRDTGIKFEELGIDGLFVDEAHNFKNLQYFTKLNIAGAAGSASARAEDMYMKTQLLQSKNALLVFGTATPITNSVSEMYNMTRYIRPDILLDAGIESFDGWAADFGNIETKAEMSPDGRSFRTKERFTNYRNAREMIGMFRQFADIKQTKDVIKNLPKAEYIDVVCDSTPTHDSYIQSITKRMETLSSRGQNKSDNMLLITNDGRAFATDMRLVASQIGTAATELDIPGSKINKAVDNVYSEYKNSAKTKGTQLVFLDFGMTQDDSARYGFDLYSDIIKKLKDSGIPEKEIANIRDYDTIEKKEKLFKKVNSGDIRVLIGSTAKMGEGMNVQQKVVALHHINAPYRPSDIEQREGRIVRFGNENKNVRIYRYIQEKSFDSYMWQMLERKGEFVRQAMSGGDVMELDEPDEFVLSAREAKAIASGNPLYMKLVESQNRLKELTSLKRSHDANIYDMQDQIAQLPNRIGKLKTDVENLGADAQTSKVSKDAPFEMVVFGKKYEKHKEAGEALFSGMNKNTVKSGQAYPVGTIRGLHIDFRLDGIKQFTITVSGKYSNSLEASSSDIGTIKKIENYVDSISERYENHKKTLERYQQELSELKENIDKPFKLQGELDEITKEVDNLNTELGITKTADVDDVLDDMDDNFKDTDLGEDSYYRGDSDDIWRQTRMNDDEPVKIKKTPSLQDLKKGMERRFEIPVSTGKVGSRTASGVFKTHADTVRTKTSNDLPVMAHELGHHFDKKYDLSGSNAIDEVITHFADSLYEKGYETDEFDSEAVAEYFREYLTDADCAEKLFPDFTEYINETFDKNDFKNLREFAAESNAYFASDIEARDKARIRSRADDSKIKDTVKAVKENPKSAVKMAADTFAMNWVDKYSPIKRASLELTGSDRLHKEFVMADNVKIQIMNALTDKLYDFDGVEVGDSLKDAIKAAGVKTYNEASEFDRYLLNRRALELSKYGIRTSADEQLNNPATMQKTITDIESKYPDFKDGADKVYEFEHNVLQFAVDAGLMTQKFAEKLWDKYPDYVPMFRAVEKSVLRSDARAGIANQKNPVKKISGSGLDVYNPVENIAINTANIMTASKRNKVMLDFVKMIDNTEDSGYIAERVTPDMVADVLNLKEVKARVVDMLSETEAKKFMDSLTEEQQSDLITTVLQSIGNTQKVFKIKGRQKANVVSVMRNGEPQYYQVHDENVLKALTSMTPSQSGMFLNVMGKAMNQFKLLTTANSPYFIFPNMIRDYNTSYIYSTTVINPVKFFTDYVKAGVDVVTKSDSYKNYVRNGGGYVGSITSDKNLLKKTMRELKIKDPTKAKQVASYVLMVGEKIADFINMGESIPRLAEYKRTLKQTGDSFEAMWKSQENTVNFKKGGIKAQQADKAIPYFKAAINSISKFVHGLGMDAKTEGNKKVLMAIAKLLATSVTMAALVQAWNRILAPALFGVDEEDYENLSANIKNNYWTFLMDGGKSIRIAKPKDLGVLSSLIEQGYNYTIGENPDSFRNFGAYMLDTFLPSLRVMGLSTAFELSSNTSWSGSPIVPANLKSLDKRLQYDEKTSKPAVFIGNLANLSPKQIDYILQQNTGFIGRGLGYIAPQSGEIDKTLGFSKLFTTDSVYSNDIISIFYDSKEKYDTYASSYRSTGGDDEKYRYSDVYNSFKYGKYSSLYSDLNKSIKAAEDEDTQREMRKKINDLLKQVNRTGETEIDKQVMALAEKNGAELSAIAPYVTVPDSIKGAKKTNDANVTYILNFDEKIGYLNEVQKRFDYWYGKILSENISDEAKIDKLAEYKKNIQNDVKQSYKQIIVDRVNKAKAG